MAATHVPNSTASTATTLSLGLDLGRGEWSLAFTVGVAQKPRLRSVRARDISALELEIHRAKIRFNLPEDTPVVSCYEAGRDGFWLHRYLAHEGVSNLVVDAASIEVNRRKRRAKTDRLDATKLVSMLMRWHNGERKLWSVVQIPTPEAENGRQLHRELISLKEERTGHINRIKGLLATLGLEVAIDLRFPDRLDGLRQWDEKPVPAELRARLLREFERWKLVDAQARALEAEQIRKVRDDSTPGVESIRRLLSLKGIGVQGAWFLWREIFGSRSIGNRRQLGSLSGLTPTPYSSGQSEREQGISKAGNKRLRWLMVQLAWGWLRYQPQSALTQWYLRRFARGSARMRKIGIVALARKLLVALWRYVAQGVVPEGAQEVPWRQKLGGAAARRLEAAAC